MKFRMFSLGLALATVALTVGVKAEQHSYVDLGLPSGTLWATCNIGASSPADGGYHFQWADTSVFPEGDEAELNCKSNGKQITDFSGDTQYDAATAVWGVPWRTPTKEECEELLDNCNWTFVPAEGEALGGYEVEGPNGNTIFLPCAGNRYDMGIFDENITGLIQSSTPYGADLYSCFRMCFADPWDPDEGEESEEGNYDMYGGERGIGASVRPVRNK